MNFLIEAMRDGLKRVSSINLWEWSDKYRMLPQVSSSEPGRYRTDRTPFLKEIMECLSVASFVTYLCVMKGTQLGFTEVGNNWAGYVADIAPGPLLMIFPTEGLAKDHSTQKLGPTIEESPRIKRLIKSEKKKDSGNTILRKEFKGGILFLSGSNSPASFRSKTIRYLFKDDVDGWEGDVGGEGDPGELAENRTDTYSYRKKIYEVSTPTRKDFSRIENSFNDSDQRYYHVPCPHCGEKQKLEWGGKDDAFGIKFERDNLNQVTFAWYECKFCHENIDESFKTQMLEDGEWIPERPGVERRGYQISSLYSPLGWVSWKKIAQQFLAAIGKPEKMKVWVNTRLGLPYEEDTSKVEAGDISKRGEPYQMKSCNEGVLLLSAGVDTHDNRIVVSVWGWGLEEESWLVYHDELWGDPNQPYVWEKLDKVLYGDYKKPSGVVLHIASMAVDAGGHRTQAVYNYARNRFPVVMAIVGAVKANRPVMSTVPTEQDIDFQGERIRNGVQLWMVGTDTAKSTIYGRLRLTQPGPGYIHFPEGLSEEYYKQLTAEKCSTEYNKKTGFPKLVWIKIRDRNEAIDCYVYAFAAAIRAGLYTADLGGITQQANQQKQVAADGDNWIKSESYIVNGDSWIKK